MSASTSCNGIGGSFFVFFFENTIKWCALPLPVFSVISTPTELRSGGAPPIQISRVNAKLITTSVSTNAAKPKHFIHEICWLRTGQYGKSFVAEYHIEYTCVV